MKQDPELNVLLGAIVDRSEVAFSKFYDQTCRLVYSLALTITSESDLAEEICGDVYAQVWTQAQSYDASKASVSSWLLTITRSRSIDLLRKRNKIRERESEPSDWSWVLCPGPSPEKNNVLRERRDLIEQAIANLPKAQRDVLICSYFSGLTHSEMARHLDLPLGTVKTRIRSALNQLRKQLEGLGLT